MIVVPRFRRDPKIVCSVIVNVCLYLKSLVKKNFAMRTRESKTTCGNWAVTSLVAAMMAHAQRHKFVTRRSENIDLLPE